VNEKLSVMRVLNVNPLRSVGMKLFLLFFASIIAFVSAVGLFSYNKSRSIIKEEVSKFSTMANVQTAEKLGMVYDSLESISLRFVVDQTIQDTYRALLSLDSKSFDYLQQMQKVQSVESGISFSDRRIVSVRSFFADGTVLNSTGSRELSVPENQIAETDWFQAAIEEGGRTVWIPTMPQGLTGKGNPSFALVRSIKDLVSGKINFVVLIEVAYSALIDPISSLELGEGGERLIIDKNGRIVYADDASLIGTEASVAIPQTDDGELQEKGSFTSNDRLVSFSKTSDLNEWYLVTSVPVSNLVQSAGQIFQVTIWVAIAAAVLAVLIGVYIIWSIGRPLVHLRDLMNEGEKGNLSVRMKTRSKDEIGQVGMSFNRMMEQITQLVKETNESAAKVLHTAAELTEVSKNTAMSAKEISLATEQIAAGASSLAIQAEKGNEMTMDIKDRMKKVVDANLEMGTSASGVLQVSEQGTNDMQVLIAQTNETEQATRSMVERVGRLQESTGSIRKVLDLLSNITKQTNILSLNASIEAARAGAAGKGFMVVADEIRKLAEQSRESIGVVGEITEQIQQEVENTVRALNELYPLFQEQISSVKNTEMIFNNVKAEMNQFINRLDEATQYIQELDQAQQVLSEAMASVSAVSEESSATSEEVASLSVQQMHVSEGLVKLAEQLESLSQSLQESLKRFKTE
jgi:Methyl-accepting chemotaxis protein